MLKLLTSARSLLANAGLLLGVAMLAASCTAGDPGSSEDPNADSSAIEPSDSISRAEQWVSAKLQYCQSANHARDYDDACTTYCNRTDNSAWDPYRSDCSGLVSWAWGLPAPGRTTWQFAPFTTDISHSIQASALKAGDAVNNSDHIMLFKEWVTEGSRAVFIEEPGCSTSITHAHEFTSDVSIAGTNIHVSYVGMTFTAIRFDDFGPGGGGTTSSGCSPGGLYCGGDKLTGDSSTLYRCEASGSPAVVQHCTNGCSVNPGQDDSCKSSSTSGGSCVAGGLYCGGDKLTGDSSTLYRCNGSGAPTVVEHCSAGCSVNAGTNDSCKASGPSGGSCVAGGLYCGGDKVSGDSSTLYKCNGGSAAPTVVTHCPAGCAVNSGSDDSCKPSGGTCVAGGLYCGGDKVSGNSSTLYKCNGGSAAPTVMKHCANGCAVLPGQNDACK